jgi:hypothetical protein
MIEMRILAERLLQLANDEGTAQIHDVALDLARLVPLYERKISDARRDLAKEVFALHEDTVERYHAIAERDTEGKQGAFARGRIVEAKSIAKAIGAILLNPTQRKMTMPNLVQRLLDFRVWSSRQQHYEPAPICKEAAIEILSLTEQIEALASVNDELRQRIGLGEAENERLERLVTKLQAALQQIADWCPATQEMTLAHEMAQEAEEALNAAVSRT